MRVANSIYNCKDETETKIETMEVILVLGAALTMMANLVLVATLILVTKVILVANLVRRSYDCSGLGWECRTILAKSYFPARLKQLLL
jgi:hypothetical protein